MDRGQNRHTKLPGSELSAFSISVERKELDVRAVAGRSGKRVLDVEASLFGFRFEGPGLFLPDGFCFLAEARVADGRGLDLEDDEPVPGLVV